MRARKKQKLDNEASATQVATQVSGIEVAAVAPSQGAELVHGALGGIAP